MRFSTASAFPATSAFIAVEKPINEILPATRAMTSGTAELIIALEHGALERWGRGDPSGFLEISADDVVYFDPFQSRRLNGIEELRALYESIRGQVQIAHFEMLNPHVQAVEDMAVLTFNYVAEGTNEVTSRWNCTEVFRREGATWRIIQTHWSFTEAGFPREVNQA